MTVRVPELGTVPIPSIETSVASVVRHASTTLPPAFTTLGDAVMLAVGAGAVLAIGGGGGGGAGFLWDPAARGKILPSVGRIRHLRCNSPPKIISMSPPWELFFGRSGPFICFNQSRSWMGPTSRR